MDKNRFKSEASLQMVFDGLLHTNNTYIAQAYDKEEGRWLFFREEIINGRHRFYLTPDKRKQTATRDCQDLAYKVVAFAEDYRDYYRQYRIVGPNGFVLCLAINKKKGAKPIDDQEKSNS